MHAKLVQERPYCKRVGIANVCTRMQDFSNRACRGEEESVLDCMAKKAG
jgi:hypothetical protein